MTADSPNGHRPDAAVELVPSQVAELAAEISETQSPTRRKRLARQIPELASRSREASWRGLQSGSQASVRGLRAGGDRSLRGLRAGGGKSLRGLRSGGQYAGRSLQSLGRLMSAQVLEIAPKIPIRSASTLRDQYPGRSADELADVLIDTAARASAGIGAAVGATAAVPFIPTAPVELGVETLSLVAVELKLIAELHETYGMPAPGNGPQRMLAYVSSWAERRGVRITTGGFALAMGSPLRRKLERRLITKAGKSTLSLAPFLTGAAAGALLNHRETRKLGRQVRDDLRQRAAGGR
jgi:hypothetical protein